MVTQSLSILARNGAISRKSIQKSPVRLSKSWLNRAAKSTLFRVNSPQWGKPQSSL